MRMPLQRIDKHEGRNPRTGEKITVPASKVVKFKAGKTLSEKVK